MSGLNMAAVARASSYMKPVYAMKLPKWQSFYNQRVQIHPAVHDINCLHLHTGYS